MSSKRWELESAICASELRVIYGEWSTFIKEALLPVRTVESRIIEATDEFKGIMCSYYEPIDLGKASMQVAETVDRLIDNYILYLQQGAVDTFVDIVERLIKQYNGKRVSLSKFENEVKKAVDFEAEGIVRRLATNRSKSMEMNGYK